MQNLQPFHSFHLAVKAEKIIAIANLTQLQQQWQQAKSKNLPVIFLGQGSNVLFLEDFQGVVMLNQLLGISHRQDQNYHYLHINGGENWHNLVQWSMQQGIYGLENLALIPGCAGSAPIQNIGAYGVEFSDFCDYVEVLNINNGEQFRLNGEQCQFGYRDSIFKQHKHYIVVAVGLKLSKNWQPVLRYGALSDLDPNNISAQQIFDAVCQIRQSKLPDPAQFGNAGSFFKNPVISAKQFEQFKKLFPTAPHFIQTDGTVKLAAGWLIEQCNLKGKQIGGAAVHQQQALVLINKDNASGEDIRQLASLVYHSVMKKFGVELQPEVRFIGKQGEIDSIQAIC